MIIRCDFKAYAEFCFWEFGDRVVNWITLNEPANHCQYGYDMGGVAPGRTQNPTTEPYIVAHNMLLSHATVVELYRQRFQVMYSMENYIKETRVIYRKLLLFWEIFW